MNRRQNLVKYHKSDRVVHQRYVLHKRLTKPGALRRAKVRSEMAHLNLYDEDVDYFMPIQYKNANNWWNRDSHPYSK